MYKFWYDILKKACPDVELINMDTDSFIFKINNQNFDDIMLEHKEYFNLRNYPRDSKYYDPINKKVLGKMKNEKPSQILMKCLH